jgi:hypothetical protein
MQSVFVDSDIDAAPPHLTADRMIDFQEFFQARIAVAPVALPSTGCTSRGQNHRRPNKRFHDRWHVTMRSGDNHRKKPC